jgi:hypothetical protein
MTIYTNIRIYEHTQVAIDRMFMGPRTLAAIEYGHTDRRVETSFKDICVFLAVVTPREGEVEHVVSVCLWVRCSVLGM